jgi:hypothetical protein
VEKFLVQNIPHGEIWPLKIAGKCRNFSVFSRVTDAPFTAKWSPEREKARQSPGFS